MTERFGRAKALFYRHHQGSVNQNVLPRRSILVFRRETMAAACFSLHHGTDLVLGWPFLPIVSSREVLYVAR